MLFVYLLEDHPQFGKRVHAIQRRLRERGDSICTSVFTAGEVLVGPCRLGAADLAAQILEGFQSPQIQLIPFSLETSQTYSQIRASARVSPADAIHLASAAQARVDLFLTNDRHLSHLVIPGIHFIAGLDVNLL
jgi:predicted nucleic acid-binding protein